MDLDKYKQAIVEEYKKTNRNIFVDAGAGCGKTTVLCQLAKVTPPHKNLIFLAFNKSIAEELVNRLPKGTRACTLHSYALSQIRKHLGVKVIISDSKNYTLAEKRINFGNLHHKKIPGVIFKLCRLYDLVRLNFIESDDVEEIINLGDRYGLDVNEEMALRVIELKNANLSEASKIISGGLQVPLKIDFTDMLYYAVKFIKPELFDKYNVLLIDEIQDFNPLQYKLIQHVKTTRGRLVGVGDAKQAIYSFQGSNLDTLNSIKNSPNTVSLPLSITYRCGKRIVEEANKVFIGGIEAASNASEGIVRSGDLDEVTSGDFVLCRNNAPIIEALIYLIKRGLKCSIIGKEFGDELVDIIDSVNDIWDFEKMLVDLEAKLKNKGIKSPTKSEAYDKMNEKINILVSLYQYFGSLQKVKSVIKEIFVENPTQGVTLSTIHKAKGLEADNVFFLEPGLIPSKYATTEMEVYAEKCLLFVAITRAKNKLIYCHLE